MSKQQLLLDTLVELADNLTDDFDVVELLTVLTDRCVEAFDIRAAGILLAAPMGTELRVMSSSSETMHDLELYELQAHEGPCLDAYRTSQKITNKDLDQALERWPRFAPAALEAGFRSVNAIPMRLRGATIGALNLFRADTGAMDDAEVAAARAFADVATIAILQQQAALDAQVVNQQLNRALNSRITLEQAKGMMAERGNLDLDTAFRHLREYARNNNRRLSDVARDVVQGCHRHPRGRHRALTFALPLGSGAVETCSSGGRRWRAPDDGVSQPSAAALRCRPWSCTPTS